MWGRKPPLALSLSHSFGGNHVLKDVSFDIGSASIYGLVGESGSGKTTLVRMMGGMEFAGRPPALPFDREQRHAVQVIFQDPCASLNPHAVSALSWPRFRRGPATRTSPLGSKGCCARPGSIRGWPRGCPVSFPTVSGKGWRSPGRILADAP